MESPSPDPEAAEVQARGGSTQNGLAAKMPVSERSFAVFLKEFAPLTHLLSQIPQHAQRGLSKVDVKLTCLDVIAEYIAIGSNVGVVFLYDRTKNTVTRLKCSEILDTITCLSLISSVDFMLAVGCQSGLCVTYQIPMTGTQSKMEKYLIQDIHNTAVTCICWSPNAMKFYSGDARGSVCCSEIDYDQHLCKSKEVHREPHAVVQLDYVPQTLLISTTKRTVVCHLSKDGTSVVQLGSHERKSGGAFGACFAPPQSYGERQVTVWACRPGMRLWKGTPEGTVTETLLLRDSLNRRDYFRPQLLSLPKESCLEKLPDSQFSILRPYCKRLLLTWSAETLFVVDPGLRSLAVVCPGFVNITHVAAWDEEVFVLQAKRHIVRLAAHPEDIWEPPEDEPLLPDMAAIKNSLVTPLAEITQLIRDTRLPDPQVLQIFKNKNSAAMLDWIRQKTQGGSTSSPSNLASQESPAGSASGVAETASNDQGAGAELQVTPVSDASINRSRSFQSMQFLDEPEAENIVFNTRKPKSKKQGSPASMTGGSTPTMLPPPASSERRPSPVPTYDEVFSTPSSAPPLGQSASSSETKKSECPPPYSASEDELVSHILSRFSQLRQSQGCKEADGSQPQDVPPSSDSLAPPVLDSDTPSPASSSGAATLEASTEASPSQSGEDASAGSNPHPEDNADPEPDLSLEDIYSKHRDTSHSTESVESSVPDVVFHGIVEPRFPRYDFHWAQVKGPGPVVSLAACDGYLCCVDSRDNVHFSRLMGREFTWHKGSRPMNRLALSPSGDVLWALYREKLYAGRCPLRSEPTAQGWDEVAQGVVSVGVTETTAWYVTGSGDVFTCSNVAATARVNRPVTFYLVPCLFRVQQVACYDNVVWVLTSENTLLARVGISAHEPKGTGWIDIPLPSKGTPACISLGYNSTGWLIDSDGNVFFKTNLKDSVPGGYNREWWQVDLNEFVYQTPQPLTKVQRNLSSVFSADKISHRVLGKGRWHLVAGKHGVWFCESMASHLYSCRRDIPGYFWEKAHVNLLNPGMKWTDIAAAGVFKDEGVVWGLQTGGQLGVVSPRLRKWFPVGLPRGTALSCIAPSPESLWVLTTEGQVMLRTGQSRLQPMGDGWVLLDTSQLGDVQLAHLSCSYETVWACDTKGTVYMRIGSLRPPAPRTLPPAWVPVESAYQDESPFMTASSSENPFSLPFEISRFLRPQLTKVYVGPRNFMVWALDNRRRVYVREGIYPELHIGTAWVEVPGVQARQLCVSEKAVWALTPAGEVYRRFGISNLNFVGDYWKRIPGHATCLAASIDDRLWSVAADGSAHQLSTCELPSRINEMDTMGLSASDEKSDADMDGWELV